MAFTVCVFVAYGQQFRTVRGNSLRTGMVHVLVGAVVRMEDRTTLHIRSYVTQDDGAYYFGDLSADITYHLRERNTPHKRFVPGKRSSANSHAGTIAVVDLTIGSRQITYERLRWAFDSPYWIRNPRCHRGQILNEPATKSALFWRRIDIRGLGSTGRMSEARAITCGSLAHRNQGITSDPADSRLQQHHYPAVCLEFQLHRSLAEAPTGGSPAQTDVQHVVYRAPRWSHGCLGAR